MIVPPCAIQLLFATLRITDRTRNGKRCPDRTIAEPVIYACTLCKAVVSIARGGTYYAANKKSKQNKEKVVIAMP